MLDTLLVAQSRGTIILAVIVTVIVLVALFIISRYFGLWIQSMLTGAQVTIFDLLGMTFRKVNSRAIVRSTIMSTQAGLSDPDLTSKALEAHYLAGGNVQQVTRALIAAKKAKTISLTFREATAIDLAGRDVLESVQTSVYPKVIDCPPLRKLVFLRPEPVLPACRLLPDQPATLLQCSPRHQCLQCQWKRFQRRSANQDALPIQLC